MKNKIQISFTQEQFCNLLEESSYFRGIVYDCFDTNTNVENKTIDKTIDAPLIEKIIEILKDTTLIGSTKVVAIKYVKEYGITNGYKDISTLVGAKNYVESIMDKYNITPTPILKYSY